VNGRQEKMGNNVIFKGSNGKLVIILNPIISFQELKDHLLEKLKKSKQLLNLRVER
jgi:septum site-determining protein MinC